jgi:cellobiose phosphorylase
MGYTTIGSKPRHLRQHAVFRAARREPRDLAAHGDQRAAHAGGAVGVLVRGILPVGRAGRRHQLPAQLQHREVEIEDGVIYHKTEYRERRDHFAWFACSAELAGFDTQREAFLGPYRGWDKPAAVERGARLSNSVAHGWAPIGSHHVRDGFAARRDAAGSFVLGYHENPQGPTNSIRRNRRRSTRRRQAGDRAVPRSGQRGHGVFEKLRHYWDGLLGICQVDTPDLHTDRMVNVWNAYQCMATFNMSRSASFYESGIGRGLGFRDSNQDLLGFVHMVPGARPRAHTRPGGHATSQRRRLSPIPAAHQEGQQRRRRQFQRRSALADRGRGGVPQGDRRLEHSGRAGAFDNQPGSEQPLYEHLQRSSATRWRGSGRTDCR